MDSKKYYIVGPESRIRELFPQYSKNDERHSNDGRMLIEVELTDMKAAELLSEEEIGLYNQEQVIELLDSEPEKWGGSPKESREYGREELQSMRKATLIEIANGKGLETGVLTKDELIDEILKS